MASSLFALSAYVLPLIPIALFAIGFKVLWIIAMLPFFWAIVQWTVLKRAQKMLNITPRTLQAYRVAAVVAAVSCVSISILSAVTCFLFPAVFNLLTRPGESNEFLGPILTFTLGMISVYIICGVALHICVLRGAEGNISEAQGRQVP